MRSGGQRPLDPDQPVQVEHVGQAFPHGLQHDRELRVARGDGQQLGGPHPLLPQRRPRLRVPSRQQQGAGRALAEAGREQRRPAHLVGDDRLELVGIEHDQVRARRIGRRVGHPQHDAVVGRGGLDLHPVPLPGGPLDGQRPGSQHPGAERAVDADPPVAELVAEPLEHHGGVGGQGAGGLLLLGQIADQVAAGELVQSAVAEPLVRLLRRQRADLADEAAEGHPEFDRSGRGVALPEGQPARTARGRGDQHLIVGDLLHPPTRGAEGEDVADPGLVDHLLVEFPDPAPGGVPTRRVPFADQEHPEQAAVGDGAAGGHGQPLRPGPGGQHAGVAMPDQPRPQLGEVLRRVAPTEHVEHGLEGAVRQLAIPVRPADQGVHVVGLLLLDGHHRDDLLGQHVERVADLGDLLDRPDPHPFDHHRRFDQIAAMVGKEHPARGGADLMTGPADALQAAGHRRRGLHLDHDVHGTHVDAQLQRRGGHDARAADRTSGPTRSGPAVPC